MQNYRQVVAVVLSCFIILGSSGLAIAETELEEGDNLITAIEVAGNQKVTEEEILEVVEIEVGESVSNKKLEQDLQSIYELGYFFDVSASFENFRGGVKLIFEVVENPELSEVEFEGNNSLSDDKLAEVLDLTTGELLNTSQLNQGLREIESYYQDQGYILAKVADISVSDEGRLQVKINEGQLAEIKVEGNEKTKDFVIKRNLTLQEGEVFNAQQMREDLRKIYNLGLFQDIQPQLQQVPSGENEVVLTISVKERKTGSVGIGAGYGDSDGWFGNFEIEEKNFRGRAQELGFNWKFGEEETTYEIDFFEPWLFGSDTSLGFNVYDRTDEVNDREEKEQGGSITLGHPLGYDIKGYLTYTHENVDVENLADGSNRYDGDTRSLTTTFVRDTRNDVFNPSDGRKDRFSVEYAGQELGGDYDFTKYKLDLRDYTPDFMTDDNTWAFHFELGLSDSDLPTHEEYTLGGARTIRGYSDDQFEGDEMMLLNAEYRIPFADNFTGVVFADAGKTWDQDEDDLNFDNLNKSAGVGVRYQTPIGQLRFDYGWQEDDSKLHFSIGQSF
ncbi:MAG: BamA/OMP85 family outer membrane protein [Bacillota bacterium]